MKINILFALSVFELVVASVVILRDVFVPTLVVLLMAMISITLRKQNLSYFEFKKNQRSGKMVVKIFGFSMLWTIFTLAFTIPVLMRLTGQQQDLSQFVALKGNFKMMITYLAITWTLAAVGEEMVYRSYIQQKLKEIFGNKQTSYLLTVGVSSLLFGLAHSEQGLIGILVVIVGGIYFSWIKKHFENNLWASVLAHGFNNTIGLVGFFIVGPVYSLW